MTSQEIVALTTAQIGSLTTAAVSFFCIKYFDSFEQRSDR